ncbi:divalent-cation tolerance protein CutA [Glycomyces sp. TRM65418]|uniref:divalent-cation tolerance protein CutA n=1 Tax=Glycomyces sp. TRM65418 TaxID=2867006 RepID=UPI001CE6370C|nr:divalent-cation tolerance protein CutA [Glycomyces sp. TRM65418]MCC3765624.1 divalent-cation tolerance protein CutA [Glycomyces sp. TRM65418]QZD55223.1 divalent-cation tolerance protein CutA [Glycomyces sp. TRM65418]
MTEFEYVQAVTTIGTEEAATALAASAVEARLAACAQVTGPVTSTYRWEGELETAKEWQVVFKTTAASYQDLEFHIKAEHGYDVPEIIVTPIVTGNPAYLEWLRAETTR